ncbi:uncharacterized protein [Periplaneta americana]|uniref:uncharacterized protein n=1 Tax=Periplaneta americana TaxID=6978 RepID=UPI0037E94ECC
MSSEQLLASLSIFKVCRFCLYGGRKMMSILKFEESSEFEVKLQDRVRSCLKIQVSEEDGLPDLICEQCISVVNRFYRYQQQCWNADAKLRCLLKKPARDPSEQSPPHHANTPPNKPESSPPETCERSFTEDLQSDDQTSSESPSSIPKNRTFSQSQLSRVPNNTKKDSTHKISKQCKQSSISRKQYTSTEKKNCHNDRTPSSSLSLSTEQKYSAPAEKRIVTSQASSCQTKNGSTSHHIKAQKSSTFSEYKASHNASVTRKSHNSSEINKSHIDHPHSGTRKLLSTSETKSSKPETQILSKHSSIIPSNTIKCHTDHNIKSAHKRHNNEKMVQSCKNVCYSQPSKEMRTKMSSGHLNTSKFVASFNESSKKYSEINKVEQSQNECPFDYKVRKHAISREYLNSNEKQHNSTACINPMSNNERTGKSDEDFLRTSTENNNGRHRLTGRRDSADTNVLSSRQNSANSEPRTDMEKTVLEAETGPSSTDIEELSSKIVHSDNKSDDIDVILKSEPVELIELIGEDGSEEEDPFNDKIEDLNTKIKSEPLNTIVLSDESSDVECNVYPVEELKSESENEVCYTENNEIVLNSKVNSIKDYNFSENKTDSGYTEIIKNTDIKQRDEKYFTKIDQKDNIKNPDIQISSVTVINSMVIDDNGGIETHEIECFQGSETTQSKPSHSKNGYENEMEATQKTLTVKVNQSVNREKQSNVNNEDKSVDNEFRVLLPVTNVQNEEKMKHKISSNDGKATKVKAEKSNIEKRQLLIEENKNEIVSAHNFVPNRKEGGNKNAIPVSTGNSFGYSHEITTERDGIISDIVLQKHSKFTSKKRLSKENEINFSETPLAMSPERHSPECRTHLALKNEIIIAKKRRKQEDTLDVLDTDVCIIKDKDEVCMSTEGNSEILHEIKTENNLIPNICSQKNTKSTSFQSVSNIDLVNASVTSPVLSPERHSPEHETLFPVEEEVVIINERCEANISIHDVPPTLQRSEAPVMQNLAIDVMKLSNMELVASSCNAESISSDGNTLVVRSVMNDGIRSELKQDLCSKPEIKSVSPVKCSVVIDDCEASEDGIDSNIRKQNNSHFKAHSSESGALSTIKPKEEPVNDSIMLHESGSLNNLNSRHTSTLSPLTQGKNDLSATKFFKMAQVEEKLDNLPSPSNENETTVEESLSDMKPLWKIEKKIEEDNIEELHEHEVIDLTSDSDDDTFPWTYDEDIVNCTYDTPQESNYHVTSPLIEDESTLELDSSIAQIPRNKQLNSPHIIGATELSNIEETQVGGMSRDDNINEVSEDGDYSPWKFEKVNVVTSKDENFSSGRQSSPSNESQDANEQSRPTNEILGGVFQTEEEDESTERNKTNKMPLSKSLVRYYHDRENNVRYSCTLCSCSYTTPWDLKKHEFTHTGVRPHVCEQCGKSFSLKASLRRHEKIHTGLEKRRYPCDICGKTFSQVTYLSHHRMSHGEEGLPFTCFHCGKAFAMKYHLKSHMRVHMGDRPYQCDICNNTFSMEEKLAEHKRKHTGKQLHKCFECGKTFTKRCYLSRHMGRHSKRREIAENQPDSLKIDTAHMIQSELS